jgi:FtsH-binding integral membrane protein
MLGIHGLLTWLSHHEYMMMLVILVVSVAGTLVFVGNLFAIIYAFGHNLWWGISVLLIPLFSVIYCARNWQRAAYAGKMLYAGLVGIGLTYLLLVIMVKANPIGA